MDDAQNLSSTEGLSASGGDSQASFSRLQPPKIGRYTILGRLGKGGFGEVFLAFDDELDRAVAIKVPRPDRVSRPADIEAYLNEARIVASLDHPHVVPVYDAGRTENGLCYVVSKLIEGSDLAKKMNEARPSFNESVALVATIAGALHFAHTRGLVHRDIKPANILIDASGTPFLADFGLALKEDEFGSGARIAGTPAYMSPEQARGEGHRVDGRSDIFSLGVVFYELLTGRRPFIARAQDKDKARDELLDLIATTETRPPRQIDDTIPKELERICQKATSKRASDRYSTAKDMAEDLREFLKAAASPIPSVAPGAPLLSPPGSTQEVTPIPSPSTESDKQPQAVRIVPKGLRSFDEQDADFFLELLPGPRDRNNLPESLRFWKTRIELIDPDKTFRVGLILGPSGCGKSSLMKAGLLPRLANHVAIVYIESSAVDTEARLLRGIYKAVPGLLTDENLVDTMKVLRRGRERRPGQKVLLVLDQFEQWLFAKRGEENTELVTALRQCDGEHLQAIGLVRADFWMAANRFMSDLEIDLAPDRNVAVTDLFDLRHARKVLTAFGHAYGALDEDSDAHTRDLEAFLDQAIDSLVQNGKIIPVRLSLFAEMIKSKPWTAATLREVGGAEGLGVTFLEETFSSAQANPKHRQHQKAAQEVLKALLPESGTDLRGRMRDVAQLRDASGYAGRPKDFEDLIRILDSDLRLITPSDPEGSSGEAAPPTPVGERSYQLTHDYLVPSLQDWLNLKQQETRQGRAELQLAQRVALWRDRPESRRLPSLLEWMNTLRFTSSRAWSGDEHRMMRAATRHHLARTGAVLALIAALSVSVVGLLTEREQARSLLSIARAASFRDLPGLITNLAPYRDRNRATLEDLEVNGSSRDQFVAELLLYYDRPSPRRADSLRKRLSGADLVELSLIRDALAAHPELADKEALRRDLFDESTEPAARLRVACVLTTLDRGGYAYWEPAVTTSLTQALLVENRSTVPPWLVLLGPAVRTLVEPLGQICSDPGRDPNTRSSAADALALALARLHDAEGLARSAVGSQPDASQILLRELKRFSPSEIGYALDYLRGVFEEPFDSLKDDLQKNEGARRRALAAVALATLGKPEILWPLLRHRPDPRLRAFLIQYLAAFSLAPGILLARLAQHDTDSVERQALLLAWAEATRAGIATSVQTAVIKTARDLYMSDPHPGVHSASELLFRRWGREDVLKELGDQEYRRAERAVDLRWQQGPNGHTLAIVPAPLEFRMGSPKQEKGRFDSETLHFRRINRSLAVITKEVSIEQYRRFKPDFRQETRFSREANCPVNLADWFDAAEYCNWLSKEDGIEEVQWCYPARTASGIVVKEGATSRLGYRLPTEAEWEYLCRAGTETARPFGVTDELLPRYAWTWLNSEDRCRPVGSLLPNEFGLFDMLGNVWEWCHYNPVMSAKEALPPYPATTKDNPAADDDGTSTITATQTRRIIRGGAFDYSPDQARSAHRYAVSVDHLEGTIGFRVVRTVATPAK